MPTHIARARPPIDPSTEPSDGSTIDESPESTQAYLDDAAHFPGGHASGVARPRHEADVAGLVRTASRVLPVGAQSSVTGGATPDGGLVLSTERLRGVHEAGQHRFRAGAGVALDTLQELLQKRGRWYAPTPTFTGAFIGGVASTNAAGAATFKYGTTRDWVEGLTVVLACGHVLSIERGDVIADPDAGFAVDCDCGRRRFAPGTYRMPGVPKCSAGYFAARGMDLIDLFVGSEGTLGVITDVTVRTIPVVPSTAFVAIFADSERSTFDFVGALRDASRETWRAGDPHGIDVAAIEHLDRRCLEVLCEDGVDTKLDINVADGTELLMLIQLELPGDVDAATAFDQAARSNEPGTPDSAIGRFTRLLASFGWLDRSELVLPGNERRTQQFLAFREAAPTGVNARVAHAKRTIDARIDKTAGDMVVPFESFGELMSIYRRGFERLGVDYAIWGHLSDGNVHPNLIPRSWDEVVAVREAILEFGRDVTRLGGSPLAEHGVGRSTVKQALLTQMYGEDAIDEMRAIKRALDPDWKLAPGVLFPAAGS